MNFIKVPTTEDALTIAFGSVGGAVLGAVAGAGALLTGATVAINSTITTIAQPALSQLETTLKKQFGEGAGDYLTNFVVVALPITVTAGILHIVGASPIVLTSTRVLQALGVSAVIPFVMTLAGQITNDAFTREKIELTLFFGSQAFLGGHLLSNHAVSLGLTFTAASAIFFELFLKKGADNGKGEINIIPNSQ